MTSGSGTLFKFPEFLGSTTYMYTQGSPDKIQIPPHWNVISSNLNTLLSLLLFCHFSLFFNSHKDKFSRYVKVLLFYLFIYLFFVFRIP
jgi:hypothetical protein